MLCTYNGEKFLREQLQSLLGQDWPHVEIVVSDDGSTDSTISILQEFETDARFRITYQKVNLGAVANFEFATSQASGAYIAFSDQDDIWHPGKLRKLYEGMQQQLLVYSDSELVNEAGASLHRKLSDLRRFGAVSDTRGFIFSNVVWGHAMMVRRELVPHVLPIPSHVPHDIWFAAKAAALSGINYVDEALTLYRQHESTVTTTIAQKATARKHEQRYRDFAGKLKWIEILRHNAREEERAFYDRLYDLFARKANGRFVTPLFFFLLEHQRVLFAFTRKSLPSRIIEIRKLSRGERG